MPPHHSHTPILQKCMQNMVTHHSFIRHLTGNTTGLADEHIKYDHIAELLNTCCSIIPWPYSSLENITPFTSGNSGYKAAITKDSGKTSETLKILFSVFLWVCWLKSTEGIQLTNIFRSDIKGTSLLSRPCNIHFKTTPNFMENMIS